RTISAFPGPLCIASSPASASVGRIEVSRPNLSQSCDSRPGVDDLPGLTKPDPIPTLPGSAVHPVPLFPGRKTMNKVEFSRTAKVPFAKRYDNYIGGKWVAPHSGRYFDNISPINGK